jgi:Na+-transporting NADH:ubiquinone oxidoreductase subunit E
MCNSGRCIKKGFNCYWSWAAVIVVMAITVPLNNLLFQFILKDGVLCGQVSDIDLSF